MKIINYISSLLLFLLTFTFASCEKFGLGDGGNFEKPDRKSLTQISYYFHDVEHRHPGERLDYKTDGVYTFEYDRKGRLVKSTDRYVTQTDGVVDGDYTDIITFTWNQDNLIMQPVNENGTPDGTPCKLKLDRGRVKWMTGMTYFNDEFLYAADRDYLETTRNSDKQCFFEWSGSRLMAFRQTPTEPNSYFEYQNFDLSFSPVQCKGYVPFPFLEDYEFNYDISVLLIVHPELFGLKIGHLVDRMDVSFKQPSSSELRYSYGYEYELGNDQYIRKMSVQPYSNENWEMLEETYSMTWE